MTQIQTLEYQIKNTKIHLQEQENLLEKLKEVQGKDPNIGIIKNSMGDVLNVELRDPKCYLVDTEITPNWGHFSKLNEAGLFVAAYDHKTHIGGRYVSRFWVYMMKDYY
ncbi:MAG: hypothetical protein D4R96_03385 [Nitrosopumilaceae archaeon]|nr:MAG: hypothetical protein D4R96_03385 [Nitrosopumilaceae archaeon]